MLKILIVNDDGIQEEGIQTLARHLASHYEVYVCAPDRQRSASSHSVTYFLRELCAEEVSFAWAKKAWSVDGTPADCVYAAMYGLMDEKPDLVISGINDGPNFSTDSIYSGTIAAAEEGMILGVPSIAVSLHHATYGYEDAAKIVEKLIEEYMQIEGREHFTLSVNIPALPLSQIKGIHVCHFDGKRQYGRKLRKTIDEKGMIHLRSMNEDIPLLREQEDERGDVYNLENGYITLSALDTDIVNTHYNKIIRSLEKEF